MKILLLGAAGFIGTNLTIELAKKTEDEITLVDRSKAFFKPIVGMDLKNVHILEADLTVDMDFDSILKDQEVVYHLVSTTVPTTSNQHISQELVSNVIFSANLFEACIRCDVKKVVFVSSGGTVYGKEVDCPLKEKTATNPISSYGVQKITIEKLLYLYRYMYGLDYRIIRLANPYGPYQRPNGVLGAVTTFTYKALKGDEITVYGDGSVVRDFIYIDDAIRAIMKIVNDLITGSSGFKGETPNYIIVTTDRACFMKEEQYQWYINGGIYLSYLTLALHSLGIGNCIMQWKAFYRTENKLKELLGISSHEAIIAVVGCGYYQGDTKCIYAQRKAVSDTLHIVGVSDAE